MGCEDTGFEHYLGWDEFLQVEELSLFAEALGVFYDLSSPGELIILMSSLSDYPNRDEILDAVNKLVTA